MQRAFLRMFTAALSLLIATSALAGEMNEPAPDFTLKSNQGENLRLEDYRGQVVMLNFWASWCGPCRQEMPLIDDIYSKYKDLGFTVLAVNVDEDSTDANRFLEAVPVSYPVLYDNDSKVSERYNVEAMPTTVMIDRDGNARFLHHGYLPGYEDDYVTQIKQLVRE
ncbi:MAG: redoxin [Alteromonadaceae bacterium]|nr:redoxin [Alteromonadaceae bacterium]MBH86972.1 redoxin [Alteromonadaceae bacterium]